MRGGCDNCVCVLNYHGVAAREQPNFEASFLVSHWERFSALGAGRGGFGGVRMREHGMTGPSIMSGELVVAANPLLPKAYRLRKRHLRWTFRPCGLGE